MGRGFAFLLFICFIYFFAIDADDQITRRQALEIVIGGGNDVKIITGSGGAPPSPPRETQDYWWWRCSSILGPPPAACPPTPPHDFESPRLAMVYPVIQAFKKKITYDPFKITKTWIGKDICSYKGFVCGVVPDFNQTALSGVNLSNYNFGGPDLTISEFLYGLKDLVFFNANSNNFTGTVPDRVGELRYFVELDLSNNKFTDKFPYRLLNATNLQSLDLRFNTFSGTIPPEIFLLNLDLLFINNNNFIQTLPDNLGSTTAAYLNLANNKFIGAIPKSIGQASNTLLEVLLLNNQLTGCLPYEIGLLKKLTVFDVGFNILTGPIPHSFQCLKNMKLLNLGRNKFYGPVPEAVCSLPKLSNFTISYNYFTHVGRQCRKLIKDGVLDVKMNCILHLPNQRSAAECAKFFSTTHTCPNETTLTYIPCSIGRESNEPKFSELEWDNASAPAQAPGGRIYGSLLPHFVFGKTKGYGEGSP